MGGRRPGRHLLHAHRRVLGALLALAGVADLPPLVPTHDLGDRAKLAQFLDRFDAGWRALAEHQSRCDVQVPPADTCDGAHWAQTLSDYLATPDYVDVFWRRRGRAKDPALELRLRRGWPTVVDAALRSDPFVRQVWEPLQDSLSAFRPEVGGLIVTRDQAREIMRHDEDRARRRAAYESGSALSQRSSPDLVELIRRRNVFAQRLGYTDFSELALECQGLDGARMEALEDTLETLTGPAYRELLARIQSGLGVFQLHGWDLLYGQQTLDAPPDSSIRSEEARARVLRFVRELGLRVDTLPIELRFERLAPWSARMVPVSPPARIVILINPGDGLDPQVSLFHEYGRALLEGSLPDPRPTARGVPEAWRDVVGSLFGSFAVERPWLAAAHSLSPDLVDVYRHGWADSRLLSLRGALIDRKSVV